MENSKSKGAFLCKIAVAPLWERGLKLREHHNILQNILSLPYGSVD